jgi:uncharacterized protein YbaP (TraB family)
MEQVLRPLAPILARASLRIAVAALVLACAWPAAAQRFDRGLLWRVEGGGAPASHVFGTLHLADPRVTRLPEPVTKTLAQAKSLTVEVAPDASAFLALAGRMMYLDGRDLAGVAGAEVYERAAALTGKLGLPEPAVRLFKPWALAILLSVPPQNPEEVLDIVLARTARAQGKPVHELETLEEQVAVFEGMSEADQVMLLRRTVAEYERMPQLIGRMVESWLARDLAGLRRIGEEAAGGGIEAKRLYETFTRRLLTERNVRMAARMQARLKEGGAFVAVGALHLYGEAGVLAELERRGWRVTRVY